MTSSEKQLKYRRARMALGLCPRCGGEQEKGRKLCASCLRGNRNRYHSKKQPYEPANLPRVVRMMELVDELVRRNR